MSKRAIFIFVVFLIIVFSIFFYLGFQIDKKDEKKLLSDVNTIEENIIDDQENETIIETVTTDEKTTPSTILTLEKYYQECGHTIVTNDTIPEEAVNLTEEEVRDKYADWQLEEFSQEEVVLYKELDSFCGEHYLLTEKDGFINIYTVDENGMVTFQEKTDLSVDYLPETDRITLKNGLMVYGTDELNKLLEDFE